MTRSMPFPGPSRPHVNNVGLSDRAPGAIRLGTLAPCAIVVTFEGSTSKPRRMRWLAASDMTTTWSAMAAIASSTER